MSVGLIWDNLVTYSLQIGLLVGLAAFIPALLRLRLPGAKLAYWQILLAACLVLPMVRPWRQAVITDNIQITTTMTVIAPEQSAPARKIPASHIALGVLAIGAVIRLGWLGMGLWRLRRYRRHAQPWNGCFVGSLSACPALLSDDVASPVTFGLRKPVILLPSRFPEFDRQKQEVILCHELLHIERRDWVFTMAEEFVRAVFWFHPAIWWLLGEIQLAREQAVDRGVVERTQARDEYVDALLAIAGGGAQLDLAPAPLFLRRRHLKQRVVSILKEVRMSKTRMISLLAAALGFLVGACWMVTTTFPLAASPQVVNDAPGVTVDVGGAALLHRSPVAYPEGARRNGVQGTVSVEAKLDASGNVMDARVLSGPDELRKYALMSVFQWHFANNAAGATRVVNITFQLPAESENAAPQKGVVGGVPGGVPGGVAVGVVGGVPAPTPEQQKVMAASREAALRSQLAALEQQANQDPAKVTEYQAKAATLQKALENLRQHPEAGMRVSMPPGTIKSIRFVGLSDQTKSELLAKLPIHEGDTITNDTLQRAFQAVKEYDEHFSMSINAGAITIAAPPIVGAATPYDGPQRIKIGGGVQQAKLIRQPKPMYPPEAKEQRIQGTVSLSAVIGKDGTIQSLEVLSGDPILASAALDAVRQWVYEPTLLNGNPVEVQTTIDVNFTLSQ